jgi:hypothetical protein
MRAVSLVLLLLSACASAPPNSPLTPPHVFSKPGAASAKLTFVDEAPHGYIYTPAVYEDSKDCSKIHFVNTNVSRTVAVPVGQPISLSVGYTHVSMPTVSWCAKAVTIVPTESEYIIRSTVNNSTKICNLSIAKATNVELGDTEKIIERQWKKPFLDGWCADQLPN